jgi:hypothetical protein
MWIGAGEALRSKNPDRVRHSAVSTRELFTHVLHSLAPDERVSEWNSDPTYYDKGKPTRRARVLYVCRGINNATYPDLLDKILAGMLAKMDLLHKGTHGVNPAISDRQAEALRLAVGVDLLLLVESDTEN